MKKIKDLILGVLRLFGMNLTRVNSLADPHFQLVRGLDRFGVDLVIDIGANVGQFVFGLRRAGYTGNIVSFEPLADAHQKLSKAANRDALWTVQPRCAVGDKNGEVEINIAANSVSSSILPIMASHANAAPGCSYVGKNRVPLVTLDSVSENVLGDSKTPFLKIDTQGFEWQVLDGAVQTMPKIRGILCELSLLPLYEGQRLWMEMIKRLEREGFALWAIQRGFTDPRDGRTLQLDVTFFRM